MLLPFLTALAADSGSLGAITRFKAAGDTVHLSAEGGDELRVQFWGRRTLRLWLGRRGNFTDDASHDLIVSAPAGLTAAARVERGVLVAAAPGCSLEMRVAMAAGTFELRRGGGGATLWSEAAPLRWNASTTWQTLAGHGGGEHFFGGGMQNGRFSHRGHKIRIHSSFNWADGGNPNSVPMYTSSRGYAAYRNTWSPGDYDFTDGAAAALGHNESRFDAFYFDGTLKGVLAEYTALTGPPFLVPKYGLGLGDSDCYHNARHGNSTRTVLAVADQYRARDFPGSWLLVNDGYGCGYGESPTKFPTDFKDLDYVVAGLRDRGFVTGLWSSTGLPNITREVAGSGIRVGKTDVGWIGRGYKYAFESVRLVSDGIEHNSDGRRFIWTVEGWAGTHRYAVMWSGDDSGSYTYLKWQIPTFVGAGFTAQAHVSGDVDGIFGGSPETYVRDLQWKCLMTTVMTMSGWAANPDKQPWTYGEPYASINRMYLKLKSRLVPYVYSLSRVAYDTGVPPVRAMVMEFPQDPSLYANSTGSGYQFMTGPWLLVAPVFDEGVTRDSIYLPAGLWHDYWNGTVYSGPITIDGYDSPLEKLPIFVRSGAIVPMRPAVNFDGQAPEDPLTLEVYPTNGTTAFQLYEDDGVTRNATEHGQFTWTNISCIGPTDPQGNTTITVGPAVGSFPGKPSKRSYLLHVHWKTAPLKVMVNGQEIPGFKSLPAMDYSQEGGWTFTTVNKRPIVHIRVPPHTTAAPLEVLLFTGPNYPRICLEQCDTVLHHQVEPQVFAYRHDGTIRLNATGHCLTVSQRDDSGSRTPAIELQACSEKLSDRQTWNFTGVPAGPTTNSTPGNIRRRSNSKSCIDQDTKDMHAEIYGCGNNQLNQMWTLEANGHIRQAGLGLHCMSPCQASDDGRWRAMRLQRMSAVFF